MKKLAFVIFISILFLRCEKYEVPREAGLISGQTFDSGLKIKGEDYNGLIIENCTFKNYGLKIGNVQDVIIRNCIFENVQYDGISIGQIGPVNNIIIKDCKFKNIGQNGIVSHEDALNCTINNCHFENVGLSQVGPAMGQPHHGIYWQGKNVTISENTFIRDEQPFGNAISIRSSGIVSGNTILGAAKNGIIYYTDHPGDDSLIIENNFIVNPTFYGIIMSSNGTKSYHNKNVIIRFNSIVQTKLDKHSIYVGSEFENTTNISIYGNLLVNSNGDYYRFFYTLTDVYGNLETTTDPGFVDILSGDLHINSSSPANEYCNGMTIFPYRDIDGDNRVTTNLDAGADEIN